MKQLFLLTALLYAMGGPEDSAQGSAAEELPTGDPGITEAPAPVPAIDEAAADALLDEQLSPEDDDDDPADDDDL